MVTPTLGAILYLLAASRLPALDRDMVGWSPVLRPGAEVAAVQFADSTYAGGPSDTAVAGHIM